MTAFTDQYSLPNIFFEIGQLYIEHTNVSSAHSGTTLFPALQNVNKHGSAHVTQITKVSNVTVIDDNCIR
jgi:hypothetical protein